MYSQLDAGISWEELASVTLPIKCTDGYASLRAGCLNTTQPLLEAVSVPQTCKNHSKPRDSDHRGEGHLTQTHGKESGLPGRGVNKIDARKPPT